MSERRWRTADVVLFCVLSGIVATFVSGYTFGEFNQAEHLPMIFRMMDAEYLAHDFYVNAIDAFNPRFYYVWLMATAGRWIPLPLLFVVLTCAANAAVAAVTWTIARRMSEDSELAAALACCTVLAVNAFNEGGAAQIPRDFLGPSLLARPFAMIGLWWTLEGRTVGPLLAFLAAMILHPLVGAETALIAVAAAGIAWLAAAPRSPEVGRWLLGRPPARLVGMGAAVLLAMVLLYGGGQEASLDTPRFIQILAEARGPHHYIPSRFGAGSHLAFAVFCGAAVLSWLRWRAWAPDREVARGVLAVGVVVLLACVGGYVFVELMPTRLWTAAQTFRMTYLVKWLGLLLFAQVGARAIRPDRSLVDRLSGALLVLGCGRYQPAIALMGNVGLLAGRVAGAALRGLVMASMCVVAVLGIALVVVPVTGRPEEPFLLALLLAIAACFLWLPSPVLRRALPTVVVAAGIFALVGFRDDPALIRTARIVGVVAPRMSLSESAKAWTEAAWFARDHTPEDAVFVVPPRLGGFRLVAQRAAVVDNKLFPFGDAAMREWYERMLFTHAGRLDGDLPSLMVLDDNYAVVDDDHLRRVQQRYGATHALLWPATETTMPVLYEDQAFKIVRIE